VRDKREDDDGCALSPFSSLETTKYTKAAKESTKGEGQTEVL
jgi:hypothetical protein